ncbi:hypothetical protein KPB2_5570 [Klebsiella pneumoniae Kb677]|nr:hypothetical protein KPB2_5570 [Klebsiella pneumoniae Kb677]
MGELEPLATPVGHAQRPVKPSLGQPQLKRVGPVRVDSVVPVDTALAFIFVAPG